MLRLTKNALDRRKPKHKGPFPFWPTITSSLRWNHWTKSRLFCLFMLASRGRAARTLVAYYSRYVHQLRAPIPDKRWPGWAVVVGIEVHAQIKSREKLFSSELLQHALIIFVHYFYNENTTRYVDFHVEPRT